MKFDKLWNIIEKKNPNLVNDKEVRMTVDGFKKAVKLAYDQGYEEGYDEGYEKGKNEVPLFENLFGKGYDK